jgi:type IV pilus assembly protein PilQ
MAAIAVTVTGAQAPTVARTASHDSPPAATVTALSVTRAAGRAEVLIGFNGDVDVQDFALRSPHRIVIDLKGATLKMGPHAYDGIARGGIKNIHIAQNTPTVVRVVLDVDRERDYQVMRGDAAIRVSLETEEVFEAWSVGARPVVTPPVQPKADADAPAAAARTTPAANPPAPKPVTLPVAPLVVPPATRLAMQPVPPPAAPPAAPPVVTTVSDVERPLILPPSPQQTGARITLSVRDMELRDVLAVFAAQSGKTIITGISGLKVNVDITDQPWETALQALLSAYGLAAVENVRSGIITVSTYAVLRAQQSSETLTTVRLPLNYARADTLAKTLNLLLQPDCGGGMQVVGGDTGGGAAAGGAAGATGAGAPPAAAGAGTGAAICIVRGKVTPEAPTNTLIITEAPSRIDSLVMYAKYFDVKPQQVNIRAQIISINRTNTNQLGVSYDLGSPQAFYNSLAQRVSASGQTPPFQVTLGGDAFAGVANASRQFASSGAVNLLFSTMIGNSSLTSFLDALSQERLSDVQSVPSVNTVDKREAKLFSGSQERFLITPPTAAGAIQSQPAQISFVDIGIKLEVTPSISANRMVRLTIYAEQSSLLSKDAAGPSLSKRNVTIELFVRDGETAYISGLEQTQSTKNRRGIPMLMNLPVIGRLFSENETIEIKDDLLILITPHILDDPIPGPPGRH